jgi:hypothetical protein|tara:strand:- start:8652 stop:8981 length:330 start_codon:yes stop_codon:yes gene_type:complete
MSDKSLPFSFPVTDMVNHPPHYNQHGVECIDAIKATTGDNFKDYLKGNIMKYLWRFDYKGKPIEDLQKARWYLDKLIDEVYEPEYKLTTSELDPDKELDRLRGRKSSAD